MTRIKKAYNYIFYKFYRMFEAGPTVWCSEYKALGLLCVLSLFFISSLAMYYVLLIDRYAVIPTGSFEVIVLSTVIFIFNYYRFIFQSKWIKIKDQFDQLPPPSNKKAIGLYSY